MAGTYLNIKGLDVNQGLWTRCQHVRFQWLADAGQPVFDLAGLLPNLIEGTGIAGSIVTPL